VTSGLVERDKVDFVVGRLLNNQAIRSGYGSKTFLISPMPARQAPAELQPFYVTSYQNDQC
jgi:hypothetical protein